MISSSLIKLWRKNAIFSIFPFLEGLRKNFDRKAEENISTDEEHPYFVFHTLIPLKKIFDKKS